MTAIDFIGDIHGHADELIELLEGQLGYSLQNGYYQHPTRKVFFVGDFIDRGPQIKQVLEIVRPMIDNGAAYTTIGNHEFNAICYWTQLQDGAFLRPHSSKNTGQHIRTIDSLGDTLPDYVEWFKTLPIYFENENFRAVHAQWKPDYINYLKSKNIVDFSNQKFLFESADKTSKEFEAIECLLKGEEMEVPDVPFYDKDGNKRYSYRIKWWLKGESLECKDSLFEFPNHGKSDSISISGYKESDVPVFFGHYWLKNSKPILMSQNVCCIDFSVAKSGNLVAYSWNGERILDEANFCFVPAIS
jgi:hypothetical protein